MSFRPLGTLGRALVPEIAPRVINPARWLHDRSGMGTAATLDRTVPASAFTPVRTDARVDLEGLFDRHFDAIWRAGRLLGLTDAEADDAAQQVFLVTARKLGSIAPGKERAFLYGVLVRVAADLRKRAARQHEEPIDDRDWPAPISPPDEALDEGRARACLERAIAAMPTDLRTVFVLFELEELTMAQIAEIVSVPPGTVASRLRRARAVFEASIVELRARFGGAP